jgi:hypothetical protein
MGADWWWGPVSPPTIFMSPREKVWRGFPWILMHQELGTLLVRGFLFRLANLTIWAPSCATRGPGPLKVRGSSWHGPHRKCIFRYCVLSLCQGNNVCIELFPSNGCCTVACLHGCYLAVHLHVIIWQIRIESSCFLAVFSTIKPYLTSDKYKPSPHPNTLFLNPF